MMSLSTSPPRGELFYRVDDDVLSLKITVARADLSPFLAVISNDLVSMIQCLVSVI
jgi:hypothetical protein